MKASLLFFLSFFILFTSFGKSFNIEGDTVKAKYSGEDPFEIYIMNNLNIPRTCIDSGLSPFSLIKFKVDSSGHASDLTTNMEHNACPELLVNMNQLLTAIIWEPASIDGRKLSSTLSIPICIYFEDDGPTNAEKREFKKEARRRKKAAKKTAKEKSK